MGTTRKIDGKRMGFVYGMYKEKKKRESAPPKPNRTRIDLTPNEWPVQELPCKCSERRYAVCIVRMLARYVQSSQIPKTQLRERI